MAERMRPNPRGIANRGGQGGRPGGPGGRSPRGDSGGGGCPKGESSPRAAVPWYFGQTFGDAPPGHRYLLYLPFWKDDWSSIRDDKQRILKKLSILPAHAKDIMQKLAERQRSVGSLLGAEVIEAVSVSPFATGLGWEHPNENGFVFLHPYGLPYLAGSGVKGVLRRAAEELALFGSAHNDTKEREWTLLDVWWLFGFEGASGAIWEKDNDWAGAFRHHISDLLMRPDLVDFLNKIGIADTSKSLEDRLKKTLREKRREIAWIGALRFFNVIPELPDDGMDVDIMNPHYGDYYQGHSTPHDAGSPKPIFFLVVPPASQFTFVVDCPREDKLPESLKANWRTMIGTVFEHAFDWLGFGAKTAVGYGAMERTGLQQGQQAIIQKRSHWVDEKIRELLSQPGVKAEDAIRGKKMAEAVRAIQDPAIKKEAMQDIQGRWKEKGWWDNPTGKSAKEAKKIYDEIAKEIENGGEIP